IVWGERIFLTSSSPDGSTRSLHGLHRADGRLLWSRPGPIAKPEGVMEKNGYASPTPVADGERVIAFLGSCGLLCCDFEGTPLWHFDLHGVATSHGVGSSPLLYKDLVILVQDLNRSDSVFLALDKRTGKLVWEQKRKRAMTWCTPVV